jgi:hypothetical protein
MKRPLRRALLDAIERQREAAACRTALAVLQAEPEADRTAPVR